MIYNDECSQPGLKGRRMEFIVPHSAVFSQFLKEQSENVDSLKVAA
jgi:hypothetical protein